MKADTDRRLAGMQAQPSERAAFKERNGEGEEVRGRGGKGERGGEEEGRKRDCTLSIIMEVVISTPVRPMPALQCTTVNLESSET